MGEVIAYLRQALPPDTIITNGAGNYGIWVHRFYRYREFGTQLAPTSGSMGYAVPAAIAAKLVHPGRAVVAFAGDGCFLMTGQEFATAIQYNAPVIFIVVNNGMYGTIRMHQERNYPGRVSGTGLTNPDFAAYARAFGGFGAVVTSTSLLGQLSLASASGQFITASAVIDFMNAEVSLSLFTPATTTTPAFTVTVFSTTTVPGLAPYESRVSLEAKNNEQTSAEFDLDNINVQMGTSHFGIQFASPSYPVYENAGLAQIDVVRSGGIAGAETVGYLAADGTARNGVNYKAVSGVLTFGEGQALQRITVPIFDDHLYSGDRTVKLFLSNRTLQAPLGEPIAATLTIVNTDAPAPTVTPPVQLLYAPHTRRVTAFRVYFSQTMDKRSTESLGNYEVLLPPAHKHGPVRVVTLSQAVLDLSGQFVTLTRADLGRQHLTKRVQIVVRGKPSTGLIGTNGTFLAGAGGVSGTDAVLTVSV